MSVKRPVAIEVRNLSKSFDIASRRRARSRRDAVQHPLGGERRHRVLEVLKDISFDIGQGEFFGIVGRNGSGKSTLLKLLSSVYRADSGSIRIAGRLAPFLELGVGFNPQLPAFENVVINGVMMGLTPRQARERFEEIVDFAGLAEYKDLRLKNYSSGMKVRLAFAVMTHVDADVMLLDEVLAVGDAAFQQKSEATFQRMRDEGRTIVLVTHAMGTINTYCDRALMIHEGGIAAMGEPSEVSNRYLEVNLLGSDAAREEGYVTRFAAVLADPLARVCDAWLLDGEGRRCDGVDAGSPIELVAELEALKPVRHPGFDFRIDTAPGEALFRAEPRELDVPGGELQPGERVRVRARVDNRLGPGRYNIAATAAHRGPGGELEPASRIFGFGFDVRGGPPTGTISLDHEIWVADEDLQPASDRVPNAQT